MASRPAYFPQAGLVDTPVRRLEGMKAGERLAGPLIVESPVTTVVVDPGASVERLPSGSLSLDPWGAAAATVAVEQEAARG